jgi:hypothetical protein
MKTVLSTALALVLVGATAVDGGETSKAPKFQAMMVGVPTAELPAKAAELVKASKPKTRELVTVEVVRAAVSINSNLAAAVAAAIGRSTPDMAATAAGAAAQVQPRQARLIARAAAAAVPGQAGPITAAVCRAVPGDSEAIAAAAAEGAPGMDREILEAVASIEAAPGGRIESHTPGTGSAPPALDTGMASVRPTRALASGATSAGTAPVSISGPLAGGPAVRGPTIAPPFVPISGTVSNLNPSTSGNVPSGGRNYAAP